MRQITEAIVHCTATRADWWASRATSTKVKEVRRWHVEDRGWSDIGYHYLIDRDGTVAKGRPMERDGAHVRGHNTGTIGISLFGGHGSSENDAFEDNFTPEQDKALRELLDELKARYGFTKVTGHNEKSAKACPGFDVPRWLAKKPPRTSLLSSTTIQASAAGVAATAGGGATAVASLDDTAQIVAIVAIAVVGLAFLWIAKERIKHWGRGVR